MCPMDVRHIPYLSRACMYAQSCCTMRRSLYDTSHVSGRVEGADAAVREYGQVRLCMRQNSAPSVEEMVEEEMVEGGMWSKVASRRSSRS